MAITSDYYVKLFNSEWPGWSTSVCKAVKTYLWLIDKTTEEYLGEDGIRYGKVLGGTNVDLNFIAKDIGLDWATVRRHVKVLEKEGKIRRTRDNIYDSYSYEVIGSRKFANAQDEDGTVTAVVNGKKVKGTTKNPDTEEKWGNFLAGIREALKKATNPEEKAMWKQKLEQAWSDYAAWNAAQQNTEQEQDDLPATTETPETLNLEPWESTVRDWNKETCGHSAQTIKDAINHVLDNPKQREYYGPILKRDLKSLARKGFVDKLVSDGKPSAKKADTRTSKANTPPPPTPPPAKTPEQKEREEREKAIQYDREYRDEIAGLEKELKTVPSYEKLRMYEIKGDLELKKQIYQNFKKNFGHLLKPATEASGARA